MKLFSFVAAISFLLFTAAYLGYAANTTASTTSAAPVYQDKGLRVNEGGSTKRVAIEPGTIEDGSVHTSKLRIRKGSNTYAVAVVDPNGPEKRFALKTRMNIPGVGVMALRNLDNVDPCAGISCAQPRCSVDNASLVTQSCDPAQAKCVDTTTSCRSATCPTCGCSGSGCCTYASESDVGDCTGAIPVSCNGQSCNVGEQCHKILYNGGCSPTEVSCVSTCSISINSCQALQKIGNDPTYPANGSYVLANNIDCSMTKPPASGTAPAPWADGKGFATLPMFLGRFDGAGHQITGLYMHRDVAGGLFSYLNAAQVKNLGLVNVDILNASVGPSNIGPLTTMSVNATITNCYATGNINGGFTMGGLVANAYGGSIVNSYAAVTITGAKDSAAGVGYIVGGLVGYLYNGGSISNSYATGAISLSGTSPSGSVNVGGLVGHIVDGVIRNSYAAGAVSTLANTGGGGIAAGGLVGDLYAGSVNNSYALGAVNLGGSSRVVAGIAGGEIMAGGLVGSLGSNNVTIANSYAIGSVASTGDSAVAGNDVGGLIGFCNGGSVTTSYATGVVTGVVGGNVGGLAGVGGAATMSNVYWNSTSSGTTRGCGAGTCVGVTAKTTAQMINAQSPSNQGGFALWKFVPTASADWKLDTVAVANTLPCLAWQDDATCPTAASGPVMCTEADILVGNQYWSACNVGARTHSEAGRYLTESEYHTACPTGYHPPSYQEWIDAFTAACAPSFLNHPQFYQHPYCQADRYVLSNKLKLTGTSYKLNGVLYNNGDGASLTHGAYIVDGASFAADGDGYTTIFESANPNNDPLSTGEELGGNALLSDYAPGLAYPMRCVKNVSYVCQGTLPTGVMACPSNPAPSNGSTAYTQPASVCDGTTPCQTACDTVNGYTYDVASRACVNVPPTTGCSIVTGASGMTGIAGVTYEGLALGGIPGAHTISFKSMVIDGYTGHPLASSAGAINFGASISLSTSDTPTGLISGACASGDGAKIVFSPSFAVTVSGATVSHINGANGQCSGVDPAFKIATSGNQIIFYNRNDQILSTVVLTPVGYCAVGGANCTNTCQCAAGFTAQSGSCIPSSCPAGTLDIGSSQTAVFPLTNSGQSATVFCPAGYTGTPTRTCTNGSWGSLSGACQSIVCPSGYYYQGSCPSGYYQGSCPTGYYRQ